MGRRVGKEAPGRFELPNRGFADLCLTTWLRRLTGEKRSPLPTRFSTHSPQPVDGHPPHADLLREHPEPPSYRPVRGPYPVMVSLYFINVTVHILAAFLWLGGLLFLGIVGAPVLRQVEPQRLRAELFSRFGNYFRPIVWTAIAVLLVTGVLNLHFRGQLTWDTLGAGAFWSSSSGRALAWKLLCVAGIVIGSAYHDFVIGPAASRAKAGTSEAVALRRRASWVARINTVLALLLIIAAARLTRGF